MMRVVVGRSLRTQTPVLEQDMKYLIFWPYWNVPPSILRADDPEDHEGSGVYSEKQF